MQLWLQCASLIFLDMILTGELGYSQGLMWPRGTHFKVCITPHKSKLKSLADVYVIVCAKTIPTHFTRMPLGVVVMWRYFRWRHMNVHDVVLLLTVICGEIPYSPVSYFKCAFNQQEKMIHVHKGEYYTFDIYLSLCHH